MQYPIIDLITSAYINNGWTGLDIPQTITYEPIQLGSGDPSPTNVRPILPATTLNIGGNDIPVYSGSLDITTGFLTVDRKLYTFTGNEQFGVVTSTHNFFRWYSQSFVDTITDWKIPNVIKLSNYPSTIKTYWDAGADTNESAWTVRSAAGVCFRNDDYSTASEFAASLVGQGMLYELATPTTYQLTNTELYNAIGIKDDIAHRLKLPLPHYFPHPVIDALQRAAAGTQTADDTEVLRHYLTPLGIGGI